MFRPLLSFLLLSIFTFVRAESQVTDQSGIFDLRDIDLTENKFVKIDGTWDFHAGNLLTTDQTDTAYWESHEVPGNWIDHDWKGKPLNKKGVATYRARILLPETNTEYAIKFYEALSAHRIFVNGHALGGGGIVGLSEDEEVPGYSRDIYRIPTSFIDGDTLEILIQVSNFHYDFGAFRRSLLFGSADSLSHQKNKDVAWQGFLLGAIVLIGLYQFVLYIFRTSDKPNLYFFMICVVVFFRSASVDEMFIFNILPDLSWTNLMKIRWATTYIAIPVALLFIYGLYPHLFMKWVIRLYSIVGVVFMLLSFVLPSDSIIYGTPYYHFFMVLGGLYMNIVVIRAAIKKEVGAGILFVGLFASYLMLINDILLTWTILNTGNLAAVGILIFVSTLAVVNGKRFSNVLNSEEQMAEQLITANKQLEEKVKERTQSVENQNKLIQEQHNSLKKVHDEQQNLLSIVVHDLKSPLNKILGLSDLIPTLGPLTDEQKDLNTKIREVSWAGQELINDLNTLGYYENRKTDLSLEEFTLSELITEVANVYQPLAEKKNISLNWKFNHQKAKIVTDQELFNRILDNVISNAVKFSPGETEICISTSTDDNYFEIAVRDQGPGFTKEDQEKLFRKFQKLSARPTGKESSTGLGLSIVKTLMGKLNGSVTLQTSPKGSTFFLKFPL